MKTNQSLYSLINNQRIISNNKTAIQFAGRKMSYSDFMDQVDAILYEIRQRNIIGEPIIIATERNPQMIASMVAIVESGNYFVPIDYVYPQERIDYIVTQSKAMVVVVDEKHQDLFNEYQRIIVSEQDLVKTEIVIDRERIHDVAYCLYTSGSTGNPKGVLIPEDALINFIKGMDLIIPFHECHSILCATTQCFDIFLLESLTSLALGVTVFLTETEDGKNPKKLVKLIHDNGIEMIQMTPSRIALIKEYDSELKTLQEIKVIMIGGEAFPIALLTDLQKKTNARIFNMYGPTETTIWSSVAELTNSEKVHIGLPILNTTFTILNENGIQVNPGEIGELYIGGLGLSKGYLYDEEKTKQRFIPYNGERIYKTGDSAIYDEEENVYKVLGRLDNQIKLNGFRIELEEIESVCSKIEGISQVVIYPYQEDGTVKKLVMMYTATAEIDKNLIIANLRNFLPDYMIPEEYVLVDRFDYTDNGKIDRKKIEYIPKKTACINEVEGDDLWNAFRKIFLEVTGYAVSEKGDERIADIIDSLHFVKFIVSVEDYYDIEVDDEYLDMNLYQDIYDFYKKILELIST